MTNKQTWEIEFDQKIKIEFGSTSPDEIKDFISQALQKRDEQWQEVFSLVKKAYWDTHTALEKMENLLALTTK